MHVLNRGRFSLGHSLFFVIALLSLASGALLSPVHAQVFPRILNGRILNGDQTDSFESVGIVGSMQFGGFCSGTLISPLHVLTAAHCAEVTTGDTDGTFIIDGELYLTSRVFIHPAYDEETLDNDIAIYELSEEVSGVEPSSILRDAPEVGELLTIVGFGGTGDGESGADGSFGIRRAGVTMIEAVTDMLVIWEFDSNDEANTAPGDSGGPGFLDVDGDLFIASVTSGGTELDAGFGDIAFNTRVDAYLEFIDDIVEGNAIAGDTPIEEPADEEPAEVDGEGCPGYGIDFDALFTAIDDWFVEEFGQTFGEFVGNVIDDIFGGGDTDEPATVVAADEAPAELETATDIVARGGETSGNRRTFRRRLQSRSRRDRAQR